MVMMVAISQNNFIHCIPLTWLQNSKVLAYSQVSLFVDPSEKLKEPYRITFLF
jgi:hypothetical protein